jgi:hypothetical protein
VKTSGSTQWSTAAVSFVTLFRPSAASSGSKMNSQLENIIRDFLGPERAARFVVSVLNAIPDLSVIDVKVVFQAGRSYCCAEPGCHFPKSCEHLICLANAQSIRLPDHVLVRWHCHVEKGARLQCLAGLGIPIESDAYSFEYSSGAPAPKNQDQRRSPEIPSPDFTGLWTLTRSFGDRIEVEYVNGIRNGVYRHWLKNGVCHREGYTKNGQWHGRLINRASNGAILDETEFVEGTGTYRIFNSNDQLTDEIPLRHGQPHGSARRWILGNLVETRHYVDGQCIAVNCGE